MNRLSRSANIGADCCVNTMAATFAAQTATYITFASKLAALPIA